MFNEKSEHFFQANEFLHNFQLNKPMGGWRKKTKHFKDGGDYGCRYDKINVLLKTLI